MWRKVFTGLTLLISLILFSVTYAQRTGIGTSTPAARFHIYTPASWLDSIFMISHGSAVLLNITSSGRVGIGTATPGATFHVVGSARISSLSSGGSLPALVISDNQGNLSILAFPNDTSKFLRGDGTWQSAPGDNWGTQTAVTSGAVTGTGVSGDAIRLINGTAAGQILKWDGTQWILANDSISEDHDWYKAGTTQQPSSITDNVYTQGDVGINTNTPQYTLHITGDGMIYAVGTTGSGDTIPAGAKTAFIWNPNKAAIRAGEVSGSQWNNANVGTYSAAFGQNNIASGNGSFVGGGGDNVASGLGAGIGAGLQDTASGPMSFIGGGMRNIATKPFAFVGGGVGNKAIDSGAVVAGGQGNVSGKYSFVGSGGVNVASGVSSAVVGGINNTATDTGAGVLAGTANRALAPFAVVGGGQADSASGHSSFVGGGASNTASGPASVVAGGISNKAKAHSSFIGGGMLNQVSDTAGAIVGGAQNKAGKYSFVGGGRQNSVFSNFSVIPGGANNSTEGDYSFVGGRGMRNGGLGTFVWGYDSTASVYVNNNYVFVVGPGGKKYKLGINVASPAQTLHVGGTMRLDRFVAPGSATRTSSDSLMVRLSNGDVIGIGFTGSSSDVLRGDGTWGPSSGGTIKPDSFTIVGTGTTTDPVRFMPFPSYAAHNGIWMWDSTISQWVRAYLIVDSPLAHDLIMGTGIHLIPTSAPNGVWMWDGNKWVEKTLPASFNHIENRAIDLNLTTGQNANLDITGQAEFGSEVYMYYLSIDSSVGGISLVVKDGVMLKGYGATSTTGALLYTDGSGIVRKLESPNDATLYLRGDLTWGNITTSGTTFWSDRGPFIYPNTVTSTDTVSITDAGWVGIGTPSPTAPLTVKGHIHQIGTGQSIFIGVGAGDQDDLNNRNNVAIGENALTNNTTGRFNIAIGTSALENLLDTSFNVAIGYEALFNLDKGTANTGIGYRTMLNNTGGSYNVAMGYQSLAGPDTPLRTVAIGAYAMANARKTVRDNIAIGYNALLKDSTGYENVAIGTNALSNNTTGSTNIAVGAYALRANTTGFFNVAIGGTALASNTTGTDNVAVGVSALNANTTGSSNIAVGSATLAQNTTGNYNVAIGESALTSNSTGKNNVGIGAYAMRNNSSGTQNVAVGAYSMYSNTTGQYNTAVGDSTLSSNTTGTRHTAIGYRALAKTDGSFYNTAVGYIAMYNTTSGQRNTAVGANALSFNTTGDYNTALGAFAMEKLKAGNDNTAVGYLALNSDTASQYNTAVGSQSLATANGTFYNTAIGYNAMYGTTTGQRNTVVGANALPANTTGSYNTVMGAFALQNFKRGDENVAIGYWTMGNDTIGNYNTALGSQAMYFSRNANYNVALGYKAGYYLGNIGAERNVFIGSEAALNALKGNYNIAIGDSILYSIDFMPTTAQNSLIAIGTHALPTLEEGTRLIAIGANVADRIDTLRQNIIIGNEVLSSGLPHDSPVVSKSVIIGDSAATIWGWPSGITIHGGWDNIQKNVVIGHGALARSVPGVDNTVIGAYAGYHLMADTNMTNPGIVRFFNNVIMGNKAATASEMHKYLFQFYENVLIGDLTDITSTTASASNLYAARGNVVIGYDADIRVAATYISNSIALGNVAFVDATDKVVIGNSATQVIGGYQNWTNYSDRRIKKDIKADVPGLEFIMRLRPVTYYRDPIAADSIIRGYAHPVIREIAQLRPDTLRYTGFIAQEVKQAAEEIGYEFSGFVPGKLYGLRYAEFVPPIVKAIQEQQKIIQQQQEEIARLKEEVQQLKALQEENKQLRERMEKIEALLEEIQSNQNMMSNVK